MLKLIAPTYLCGGVCCCAMAVACFFCLNNYVQTTCSEKIICQLFNICCSRKCKMRSIVMKQQCATVKSATFLSSLLRSAQNSMLQLLTFMFIVAGTACTTLFAYKNIWFDNMIMIQLLYQSMCTQSIIPCDTETVRDSIVCMSAPSLHSLWLLFDDVFDFNTDTSKYNYYFAFEWSWIVIFSITIGCTCTTCKAN